MEKLEISVKAVPSKPSEEKCTKGIYAGLRLVEETAYQGPTGKKYWM